MRYIYLDLDLIQIQTADYGTDTLSTVTNSRKGIAHKYTGHPPLPDDAGLTYHEFDVFTAAYRMIPPTWMAKMSASATKVRWPPLSCLRDMVSPPRVNEMRT